MISYKYIILLFIFGFLFFSCGKDDSSEISSINEALNSGLILPPGSFKVSQSQLINDGTINVSNSTSNTERGSSNSTERIIRVEPSQIITINIFFTSIQANITHGGVRFGNQGDIWLVPIQSAFGNTSGILTFDIAIPSNICNNIQDICHDIKCYEFAIANSDAEEFIISNENINDVVLGCAACDEPSCRDLVPACDCDIEDLFKMNEQLVNEFSSLDILSPTYTIQACDLNNRWIPLLEMMIECAELNSGNQSDLEFVRSTLESNRIFLQNNC